MKKYQPAHCPEVEQLMGKQLPFVTCHGITIAIVAFSLICASLLLSGGTPQQMIKEVAEYIVEQIKAKIL